MQHEMNLLSDGSDNKGWKEMREKVNPYQHVHLWGDLILPVLKFKKNTII